MFSHLTLILSHTLLAFVTVDRNVSQKFNVIQLKCFLLNMKSGMFSMATEQSIPVETETYGRVKDHVYHVC